MDLTIIIVNWNTRELLRNCLQSIEQHRGNLAVETFVVDNASKDGSSEMVADCFHQVQLINSGGNIGFARANNLAVPRASADLVLFLNPDTEIRPQSLQKMVQFMQANPSVGGLGCKIRDASGEYQELGIQRFPSPFTELLRLLFFSQKTRRKMPRLLPYHDPHVSGDVKKLFGACLLVRGQVLKEVGSFDERFFMYCEDVDLCQRIDAAGWRLHYLSDAEILHLGASASSTVPGAFSILMGCHSFSQFMRKHHGLAGDASYRMITFLGAQVRLLMLLGLKMASALRLCRPGLDLTGSIRKYLTITRWTLGLQKPVVRS